jgi:transcriptional regulator of arginine metabolism
MSKALRQRRILDLVSKGSIESQDDLRRELVRLGMRVTQATLSRDINELGLVKTPEGYAVPQEDYLARVLPSLERLLREFVVGVRPAGQLLVLKTMAGSAQAVAAALDAEEWPEVVGTLAGDDTILVVTASDKNAKRATERVQEVLGS